MSTNEDIEQVAILADEIWTQHFTPIIGATQVDYMLRKYQSPGAIKSQIKDGAEYYLANLERAWVGYAGLSTDIDQDKILLSKIYVKSSVQGKGVGTAIFDYVESNCVLRKLSSVWLTVNRNNDDAISWYKRRGFVVVDKVKKDIGEGFFMDDYLMEKLIPPNK